MVLHPIIPQPNDKAVRALVVLKEGIVNVLLEIIHALQHSIDAQRHEIIPHIEKGEVPCEMPCYPAGEEAVLEDNEVEPVHAVDVLLVVRVDLVGLEGIRPVHRCVAMQANFDIVFNPVFSKVCLAPLIAIRPEVSLSHGLAGDIIQMLKVIWREFKVEYPEISVEKILLDPEQIDTIGEAECITGDML